MPATESLSPGRNPVSAPLGAKAVYNLLGILMVLFPVSVRAADIGQKVEDFRLEDAAGKPHSLKDYSGNVLVLAFWSFKCPAALAIDDRLTALHTRYSGRGVVLLAVDSNANESKTEIQRNAENLHLPFPILMDVEGVLAQNLGATVTPSVFVIDRSGLLRYKGSLESKEDKGRPSFAEKAIENILSGEAVTDAVTQASGCSIRRKSS